MEILLSLLISLLLFLVFLLIVVAIVSVSCHCCYRHHRCDYYCIIIKSNTVIKSGKIILLKSKGSFRDRVVHAVHTNVPLTVKITSKTEVKYLRCNL